jgi:hypothetical protein
VADDEPKGVGKPVEAVAALGRVAVGGAVVAPAKQRHRASAAGVLPLNGSEQPKATTGQVIDHGIAGDVLNHSSAGGLAPVIHHHLDFAQVVVSDHPRRPVVLLVALEVGKLLSHSGIVRVGGSGTGLDRLDRDQQRRHVHHPWSGGDEVDERADVAG